MNKRFTLVTFLSFLWYIQGFTGSEGQQIDSHCKLESKRNESGTCKLLRNCAIAISDLRSGVNPTLCYPQVQGKAIVCCPSQPRISEMKCEEYKKLVLENKYTAVPFLPLEALDKVDYGVKEVKCSALTRGIGFIVGGRNARQEEFPHMAGLGYGSNRSSLNWQCGGALISDRFVLTAAHCVTPGAKPTHVLLGDIHMDAKLSDDPRRTVVKISQVIIHPDYRRPKKYNDLALLRLENSVNFSLAIRPACLPQPNLRPEMVENMSTTGWGRVGLGEQSEVLQAVNLTRFSQADCNKYYNNEAERRLKYPQGIIRSQICAGSTTRGKDTCSGDSGGPLVISDAQIPCLYYIVGATSFGARVCGYQPGIYTNIQSYLNWIEDIVWPI